MSQGLSRVQAASKRVRRWWPWIVLSAILHLPFTPVGAYLGLLSLLIRLGTGNPDEAVEELSGIPVELLAEAAPPSQAAAESGSNSEGVVVAAPKPPRKAISPEPADAGVADAGSDAGAPDAGRPMDGGLPDVGMPDAGTLDGGTVVASADAGLPLEAGAPKPDAFAIGGELGKFQKGNVNVRIHLFPEPLSRHPAGSVIAGFLAREPQWQEFLGPSGLDPLSDFRKIVIMGPQLVDSSQVGVFLEYKAEPIAIRKAVDALVQRTQGARWETKNKKPVAYVHAAGGERVIVLYPNRGVAIVPPKPAEQMIALSKFPGLNEPVNEDEILQLLLRTPHRVRAFKRAGVEIPHSISLARVSISGARNGGAHIEIELEDESPESAVAHAPDLERELSKATMGFLSLRLTTDGTIIRGAANLSPLIVGGILREVQKRFVPKQEP